jgi:hypothetical protein
MKELSMKDYASSRLESRGHINMFTQGPEEEDKDDSSNDTIYNEPK